MKTISRYLLSFLTFYESNSLKKGFLPNLIHLKRHMGATQASHNCFVVHQEEHMNDLISNGIMFMLPAQKRYSTEIQYFKTVTFFGRKYCTELLKRYSFIY